MFRGGQQGFGFTLANINFTSPHSTHTHMAALRPSLSLRFALRASDVNVLCCLPRLTVLELGLGRLDLVGAGGGGHTLRGGGAPFSSLGASLLIISLMTQLDPPFWPS